MSPRPLSRRSFLKISGGALAAAAIGIHAFPKGKEIVQAAGPGVTRVTRSYRRLPVARISEVVEGQPIDFSYPMDVQRNFLVKLGKESWGGVGPEGDIVAFNYLCTHMGGPLQGTYRHEYGMLGPCPFHFSRFDLSKNGTMILGQATQSLPQIVLSVDGDEIYAEGVTGLLYGTYISPVSGMDG